MNNTLKTVCIHINHYSVFAIFLLRLTTKILSIFKTVLYIAHKNIKLNLFSPGAPGNTQIY